MADVRAAAAVAVTVTMRVCRTVPPASLVVARPILGRRAIATRGLLGKSSARPMLGSQTLRPMWQLIVVERGATRQTARASGPGRRLRGVPDKRIYGLPKLLDCGSASC